MEFTDRYQALEIPEPDPVTMCPDQCEGTGWVPVCADDTDEPWRTLWLEAEREKPNPEGDLWHMVVCPACQGTGKKTGYRTVEPSP